MPAALLVHYWICIVMPFGLLFKNRCDFNSGYSSKIVTIAILMVMIAEKSIQCDGVS